MNANVTFSNLMLRLARKDARKAGVKIPKLSSTKTSYGANTYYTIHALFPDGSHRDAVWEGTASCAAEAKANYISQITPTNLAI
jgi:hypothetical protein